MSDIEAGIELLGTLIQGDRTTKEEAHQLMAVLSALRSARRDAETLREALQEISEGKGRYSRVPIIHAVNTIEDMKALALNALQSVSSSPPILEKNDRGA